MSKRCDRCRTELSEDAESCMVCGGVKIIKDDEMGALDELEKTPLQLRTDLEICVLRECVSMAVRNGAAKQLSALRAENERLRGLLREIDDEMEHDNCYICARCRNATGHAPDCRLAAALECKP